jgi:hypothetical protein
MRLLFVALRWVGARPWRMGAAYTRPSVVMKAPPEVLADGLGMVGKSRRELLVGTPHMVIE